jgi:hypothetical protein
MKSIADGLPPELAKMVHPDWRKNEEEYWHVRDSLLSQYQGKWIGFADGKIVAEGTIPVNVFHAAMNTGLHPYYTCVGHEHEPCMFRRAVFAYDATYPQEPMPRIQVEFCAQSGSAGVVMHDVIPDTGADASALPWKDCQLLQLGTGQGVPSMMGGLGSMTSTYLYQVFAKVDGVDYPCRLHVNHFTRDRILGRDILNQLDILFRGPAKETIINP